MASMNSTLTFEMKQQVINWISWHVFGNGPYRDYSLYVLFSAYIWPVFPIYIFLKKLFPCMVINFFQIS